MTEQPRMTDDAEEAIEDLEAPAAAQAEVAGGQVICAKPTCNPPSNIRGYCQLPTCGQSKSACGSGSIVILVYEQ
jgi:hypothetical protein